MDAKLTPRQSAFVAEYLVDLNAAAAARRAGYSARTARSAGQRLLTKVDIADAVRNSMASRSRRTAVTADRVIQELAKIAFFDPRRLFRADGMPLPVTELDEDTAAAVAGLEVSVATDESGTLTRVAKIKLADKLAALEKLGRHLGLFEKGQPGTAESPIAVLIRSAQGTSLPVVANPPADDDDVDDWGRAKAA